MLIIFHYIGILIYQILQKRKRQKCLENIKDRVKVKLVDSTLDDKDNFNENLDLKSGSTTVHNLGNIIDETDLESNIKFDPPVFRQRYAAVYQTLIDERWRTKILKLCDFGCAEFGLFTFIKKLNRLNDILFVDIDEDLLKDNVRRIHPLTIEYLKRREEPLTVTAFAGSVGDPDYRILDTDVITAIELIEHLYPDDLEAFPYNVFNYAAPKLVIITTPNADFNVLFSNPLKFRHDDHKFEWTREQFEDWANNIIIRFPDYLVNFSGLGEGPDGTHHLGHCSQMALFIRKDLLNENYKLQKYSIPCICPNNADCKGTDSSRVFCKCVCPCCSPKASYGICSFNSFSKMVRIDQTETKNKNESLNIFYKAVEKIEYPFERDNRSEEEKLMDEFTYRINSLGQPNSRFFVEERERAEIPLGDLLYGPDDGSITVSELSNLLAKHNYQIEKCVIPETKELETCVIFEPLMDNTTSSSEHSDFDTNSGYYQSVKESMSDWDDVQQDQKEFKVDSSSIEVYRNMDLGDSISEEVEDESSESSLNSEDPVKRKCYRQSKIQKRLTASSKRQLSPNKVEEEKNPVQLQVERSNAVLDKLIREGTDYLTNIQRAASIRLTEKNRIDKENKERIKREFKIQAEEAEDRFEEIITKWTDLQILNDPLHIHDAILRQKTLCEELLRKKEEFIEKLRLQVVEVDKQFTKDRVKYQEDMDILTHRINFQIKCMRQVFRTQWSNTEKVIHEEQEKFIQFQNDLWNRLHDRYIKSEESNLEFKLANQEEIKNKLFEFHEIFEEELRRIKSNMTDEAQFDRNELERIKAIVLTNTEKFHNNFFVIETRKNENFIIKAQQKKELNKLEDELSDTQKKIRAIKAESSKQIEKYNNDIKKLNNDILHIEIKADHYNSTNNKLFNQIWDMNKKNVLDILDKIFQTDKVLNEQVLGVHWHSPDYREIDKHYMPSYRHAQEALQRKLSSAKLTAEYRQVQKQPEVRGSPRTNIQDLDSNRAYRRLVKHLLMLVSDKSGFLTENRLKSIINNYEDRDRTIVKLCNVFDCLDLQKSEDIDALVSYFLPFCYCSICAEFDNDPSSESDTLHDALSEFETTRPPVPPRTKKSKISKLPISTKQLPTRVQNPPTDEQEETDLFEETVSTPSLSSQDNKVHLKRASNIEKTGFIQPPPPLDVNKMKLDFNRINELDRVHNIPIGRNFFGHLLRPPAEKLRKSYLKDRDCLPGPSSIPTKKRKKIRVAGMTSDPDDDISPLDDIKSVTNCIVENTLNKLNVDEVKANKDDVIEFNIQPVEEPKIETDAMEVDMEHNGNVEDSPKPEGSSSTPISQNIQDETLPEPDIENHKIRLAVDLSPIEQDPNHNNCISSRIVTIPMLSNVPPNSPNTVLPLPFTPIAPNIQIPTAPLLQYLHSSVEIREQEEKYQDIDRRDIARASREAIVDPNSVQDLLEDFDVNNSVDELTGVDIMDLGNCILVGIHPVLEDTDIGQTSNGFPHWLLQILGTAAPMPERSIDGTLEEAHYYCQGDGLGVHPSVIAVDLDDDNDDDDEHSSQSSNETNTTDFAEIDPGSSQDMSSLPEDSIGTNIIGESQDPLDDTGESGPSPILPLPNHDPGSNSSDTGMQTSKSF